VKERLPDMTSHRMLLDVGVSQKKKIKMQQTSNFIWVWFGWFNGV